MDKQRSAKRWALGCVNSPPPARRRDSLNLELTFLADPRSAATHQCDASNGSRVTPDSENVMIPKEIM